MKVGDAASYSDIGVSPRERRSLCGYRNGQVHVQVWCVEEECLVTEERLGLLQSPGPSQNFIVIETFDIIWSDF